MARKKHEATIKRILTAIGNYKWMVAASLFCALVTVALTLSVPILIGKGVDCILGPGQVDFKGLWAVVKTIGAAVAVTCFSQWTMSHLNNKVAYRVVKDLRTEAFHKLEVLPLSYLDSHAQGDLISRVITDVDQFSDGLLMGFTQLFTGVMTIVGTLAFMFYINPLIGAVVVVVTPVSLVVASFIAKRTYQMFRLQSEARGELTGLVDEMVGNQKVVQAFGQEQKVEARFGEINERLREYGRKAIFYSSITNPATRFVNSLVYASVGIAGAAAAVHGFLTVGQLASFLSYANQYTKPFNEISGVVAELQNALVSAARVFELIDQQPQKPDAPDGAALEQAKGKVDLEQVCFSYNPSVPLIENLNLKVQPGQRIAIVGPTGCGKSTLINLLMRFYDVDQGAILVDGMDVRKITRKSLRANYGMVLQETWLRTGTIGENISFGRPEASMEEVVAAGKKAHAHSFIKRMPQGYDTVVSEDGGNLSQGQKQLLSIARVMLCLPPMLILDEATSSIDTMTEVRVQKAFTAMMEGRTCFLVAHRLSTIREADQILVMREGRIVEQGTHQQLLDFGGFYAELYQSQFER